MIILGDHLPEEWESVRERVREGMREGMREYVLCVVCVRVFV